MFLSKSDILTLISTSTAMCDDEEFNKTLTLSGSVISLLGCAPKEKYENQFVSETYIESLSDDELNNFLEKLDFKEKDLIANTEKKKVLKRN